MGSLLYLIYYIPFIIYKVQAIHALRYRGKNNSYIHQDNVGNNFAIDEKGLPNFGRPVVGN